MPETKTKMYVHNVQITMYNVFYVCSRNIGVNIKYKCLTNIYLYLDFIRMSALDFANLELVE
jgi:hypothetical protein